MKLSKSVKELIFLNIVFFYIALIFFNSKGTHNYDVWVFYLYQANAYGIIDGYSLTHGNTYPPFSALILKLFYNFLNIFDFKIFTIIKATVTIFFYLSIISVYLYSKNIFLSIFFIFSFLISSMGMLDLDIICGLFLILSLIALKKNNIFLFSILYCISILTKWQPIVIFPFIAIYISELNFNKINEIKNKNFNNVLNLRNLAQATSVVFLFILICSLTYGFLPIAKSFYVALKHTMISGNALNFNWLITWIIQLSDGTFVDRIIYRKITSESPLYVYLGSIVFFTIFFFLIFSFANKKNRKIEDTYYYCAIALFAQFIFNKGEHQNHLFTSALFFLLLAIENKKFLIHSIITSIIFNLNLITFYGIDGHGSRMTPALGIFDFSIILALLNVLCFIYIFFLFFKKKYNFF